MCVFMLKEEEKREAARHMAPWIINLIYKYEDWNSNIQDPSKTGCGPKCVIPVPPVKQQAEIGESPET